MTKLKSIEIYVGTGGQAMRLKKAGFEHIALVEIEPLAYQTLLHNRPKYFRKRCKIAT